MTVSKLKWTAATREQVHYFRSTHAKDPEGAHALPSPAQAWALLRSIASTGRGSSSAGLASALDRLHKELAQAEPPSFDRAFELYRYGFVSGLCATDRAWASFAAWAPERAMMALWTRGALAQVLEVLTTRAPFWRSTASEWTPEASIAIVELADQPTSLDDPPQPSYGVRDSFAIEAKGLWAALKLFVDGQDAASFERSNTAAHAFRRGLDTDDDDRSNVALAFARDPSHAREECARAWSNEVDQSESALRVILASPTIDAANQALEYVSALDGGALSPFAYDLAEAFGGAAAPLLHAANDRLEKRKMNASLKKSLQRPLQGAHKLVSV